MAYEGVMDSQALRLVMAYGLRDGALAPVEPDGRPPYVPYCEDLGVSEITYTSRDTIVAASRLWEQGLSIKAIATELNMSVVRVAGITCRYRESFPYRNAKRKESNEHH